MNTTKWKSTAIQRTLIQANADEAITVTERLAPDLHSIKLFMVHVVASDQLTLVHRTTSEEVANTIADDLRRTLESIITKTITEVIMV